MFLSKYSSQKKKKIRDLLLLDGKNKVDIEKWIAEWLYIFCFIIEACLFEVVKAMFIKEKFLEMWDANSSLVRSYYFIFNFILFAQAAKESVQSVVKSNKIVQS